MLLLDFFSFKINKCIYFLKNKKIPPIKSICLAGQDGQDVTEIGGCVENTLERTKNKYGTKLAI